MISAPEMVFKGQNRPDDTLKLTATVFFFCSSDGACPIFKFSCKNFVFIMLQKKQCLFLFLMDPVYVKFFKIFLMAPPCLAFCQVNE